jgi:hypothetical protein
MHLDSGNRSVSPFVTDKKACSDAIVEILTLVGPRPGLGQDIHHLPGGEDTFLEDARVLGLEGITDAGKELLGNLIRRGIVLRCG